jgi:hypothetical protein
MSSVRSPHAGRSPVPSADSQNVGPSGRSPRTDSPQLWRVRQLAEFLDANFGPCGLGDCACGFLLAHGLDDPRPRGPALLRDGTELELDEGQRPIVAKRDVAYQRSDELGVPRDAADELYRRVFAAEPKRQVADEVGIPRDSVDAVLVEAAARDANADGVSDRLRKIADDPRRAGFDVGPSDRSAGPAGPGAGSANVGGSDRNSLPGRPEPGEVGQLPKYGPGRCVICGKELTGRQKFFCSKEHGRLHYRLEVEGDEAAWRKLDWTLHPPECGCGCGQLLKDKPIGSRYLNSAHAARARRRRS